MGARSKLGMGLLVALVGMPAGVLAGGFEVPDNGARAVARGTAFTVRADDLTAIAHNPGGLTRQRGTSVLYSHNLFYAPASFTRDKSVVPATHKDSQNLGDPFATVHNESPWFPLGAMVVAATDFGMEDWRFAAGVYGPNASGKQTWPLMGGQRYMLTGLDLMLVYYSAAVAWGKKDRFGIGLTMQGVHQISTEMSMVVDATTGDQLNPYYAPNDVHATISLSAPLTFSAILGVWLRLNENFEVAASGRIMPARLKATGDIRIDRIEQQTAFTDEQLEVEDSAARLELVIPPTARAGVRYRSLAGDRERFDVELNVVYEAWSMMESMDVELDGIIKLFVADEAPDVRIQRRWRDTVSVRLGGTWNAESIPLSFSAGGFVENGAVPTNYSHLDFVSFDRLGLGAGVQGRVGVVDLALSYSHVFQESRQIDEKTGKVYQVRPISPCPDECGGYTGIPVNAGLIETSFDIFALSAQVKF